MGGRGAIRADGEPAAQPWEIDRLDLQSIAGAEDVGVVGNSGALLNRHGWCQRGRNHLRIVTGFEGKQGDHKGSQHLQRLLEIADVLPMG